MEVRSRRRRMIMGAVALTATAALTAGGQVTSAPAAAAAPAVPAVATADVPLPPPLPPLPLPPLPGDMRSRGEQAKARFDGKMHQVPASVTSWGVDEATGKLVVNVVGKRTGATDGFTADADPAAVTVRTDAAPNRTFEGLVDGTAIRNGRIRCSIGFSATYGPYLFIATAGHCTNNGGTWSGPNGTVIGPTASGSFPNDDFGGIYVQNTAAWQGSARVQGGPIVRGSAVARIGAQVCRSGSTTGYRCGVIQAYNQTVNYGSGNVVSGLTRTTVCAEPGDSGGAFITPAGQAQGLTSGGSGNCTSGGTTYFQPINEYLQRYAQRLVTG